MTKSVFNESNGIGQDSNRPVHGSIKPSELRSLGLNPDDVLDFSASINPLGPPDSVIHAIQNTDISAYSPFKGKPIESQTVSQIVDKIKELPKKSTIYLFAPVVSGRKG